MILSNSYNYKIYLSFILVIYVCLITACHTYPPPPQTQPCPQIDRSYEEKCKVLEDKIAHLQLLMLEKDAQINAFEDRHSTQQNILDDVVMEVVRAKSKLRSLESKAEAASNMAEAEIAIEALKMRLAEGEKDIAVLKAERLLKLSAEEFKKENYGGSLYLTSQAKAHIKAGQIRFRDRNEKPILKREVLFVQPLPLQVLKKSNLRQGPDLKNKVVKTLDKNALVVGYSYKNNWVRVKCEDGVEGWIFRNLLSNR